MKLLSILMLTLTVMFGQGCAAFLIGGGAAIATKTAADSRSVGTQVDDSTLEWRINNELEKSQKIKDDARIIAIVYGGKILLVGQADPAVAEQAKKVAMNVEGTSAVYNEVRSGKKISFGTISSDAWITTKVRSRLMASNLVSLADIKVTTENGEVFLIGSLKQKESMIAAEIASRVSGVKRVTTAFTVVP